MTEVIRVRRQADQNDDLVSDDNPFPVALVETSPDDRTVTVTVQLDTSTTAYTAGDAVGSRFAIPNAARTPGGGGYIDTVTLVEDTTQAAIASLYVFNQQIAGTADNAAFGPSDAEMRTCVGRVDIVSYPVTAPANNQMAQATNGPRYHCGNGLNGLWAQLQTHGAPTYALNGVVLKIELVRD